MKEKSRCSILFHLLVPGGRWLTTMSKPSLLASFCNSRFHSRTREPLLPPPSAVISNRRRGDWNCQSESLSSAASLPAISRRGRFLQFTLGGGTGGSNPASSSGESTNHRFRRRFHFPRIAVLTRQRAFPSKNRATKHASRR